MAAHSISSVESHLLNKTGTGHFQSLVINNLDLFSALELWKLFVPQLPWRLITDAGQMSQIQFRNIVLVLCRKVHGLKPRRQVKLSWIIDRAFCQCGLDSAVIALENLYIVSTITAMMFAASLVILGSFLPEVASIVSSQHSSPYLTRNWFGLEPAL
jgi:hypothetical protein